ncbi:hypothetical protein TI04_00635 [Achromatium sp. WMS2]|nr:hypothetical protein TI04_00635 [Achromatium sp. WMS2]
MSSYARRWQFTLTLGILLMTGCGFQLRGSLNIPTHIIPLYIQAVPGSSIALVMQELLTSNSISTTIDVGKAKLIVHIIKEDHNSRVIAVNKYGKVLSSELSYQVTFEFLDNKGSVIREPNTIMVSRNYVNPEVEVLGKTEEANMIRQDLEQEMATRILIRLRSLSYTESSNN